MKAAGIARVFSRRRFGFVLGWRSFDQWRNAMRAERRMVHRAFGKRQRVLGSARRTIEHDGAR